MLPIEAQGMQSVMVQIARAIRKRRRFLKLTQTGVAAMVGCSQAYLAQVETGRLPLSRRFAEKVEVFFGVRPGSYGHVSFRRGRPTVTRETSRALRHIRFAQGPAPRPFPALGTPRHPHRERARGLKDPLAAMGGHLGGEAGFEVESLELLRTGDDRFWRHLQSIPYASWSEKRLHVNVGLAGASLTGVAPARLGCLLACAHGRTGRDTRRRAHPAFVWQWEDMALALFPQRCVATEREHFWPDNVLVAACNGQRVTAVIEVDGPVHQLNRDKEAWRDGALGVPVLHLDAAELGRPGVLGLVQQWARRLFPRVCFPCGKTLLNGREQVARPPGKARDGGLPRIARHRR